MELNISILDREFTAPFEGYILPLVRKRIKTEEGLLILGAALGNSSVGALVAAEQEGVMELLSLFVDEQVRRNGIGSMLLTSACKVWKESGRPVNYICTEFMAGDEDKEELKGFFDSMGFEIREKKEPLWCTDSALLHNIPVLGDAFSPNFKKDEHVHYYTEVTKEQLEELEADESVPDFLKPSGLKQKILRQPSTVWIEDGKVLGWNLLCESFDGGVILAAAYKREGAPKGCFRKMVTASANRNYLMLGHDFPIYNCTVNDHASELTFGLTQGAAKRYSMFTARTGIPAPEWLTAINSVPAERKEEKD